MLKMNIYKDGFNILITNFSVKLKIISNVEFKLILSMIIISLIIGNYKCNIHSLILLLILIIFLMRIIIHIAYYIYK